ncbi:MAG: divergent PAP2 family protein [Candidatus Goldbacteria bacterium]|nr:divergent PAP2 family protein [Candidatus Goldiibacteriota bacterium]
MDDFLIVINNIWNTLVIIVTHKIFYITFFTWLIAQTLKVLIFFITKHKFDFRLFVGTGGMPSSHTAAVSAITTTIGLYSGWDSPIFMVSLCYALIVISDAMGVRRAAGKQAVVLNKMMDEIGHGKFKYEKRLKELLGHTPLEAFAGILIGIIFPILMF